MREANIPSKSALLPSPSASLPRDQRRAVGKKRHLLSIRVILRVKRREVIRNDFIQRLCLPVHQSFLPSLSSIRSAMAIAAADSTTGTALNAMLDHACPLSSA
ncbi:MAG: hypothetical protein ACLR5G_12150 [Eubacteriales bacterium]